MPKKSKTVLFAGPTLTERSRLLIVQHGIDLRPPIERHIIPDLVKQGFDGTFVIVDGMFRQNLAVGHAEIRHAIARGLSIWGLSSMGAIRAYEMQELGVRGFGRVFDWFQREEDFQDDEVALLHTPITPYHSSSEPLVHFRECMIDLVKSKMATQATANAVIGHLKDLYFGERTMELFFKLLQENNIPDIDAIKNNFSKYRIKELDLELFLEKGIWLS